MATEPAGNGLPRLIIKRLELENFKSYAGVQHIGPFHKSFSAIVGPNGSGKSNTIDAMLFVFGARAKKLRLNKVSELIHNSANNQNLEAARVSVYFEEIVDLGGEDYEVVEGSEIVVTRTAQRNNTSQYYLNDKKSNFTEVTNFLKLKGVDLNNNRFLILQGEVEQISQMKPKAEDKHDVGLLEYLEDIIGTDRLKEPIEACGAELEELNSNRHRVVQRVKITEAERDALKEQRDFAVEYCILEGKLYRNQALLCHHEGMKAQAQVQEADQSIAEISEELEAERSKCADNRSSVKTARAEVATCEQRHKKAAKQMDDVEAKEKDLKRNAATAATKITHLKKKVTAAKAAAEGKLQKAKDQEQQAELAQEDLPVAEQKTETLQGELKEAEGKLAAMKEDIKDEVQAMQQRLSDARAALAPWQAQMQAARNARSLAVTKRDLLQSNAANATKRLHDVQQAIELSTRDEDVCQQAIQDMAKQMVDLQRRIDEAGAAQQAAAPRLQQAEKDAAEANATAAALRASIQNETSRNRALEGLSAAQRSGELQGVLGRLGDLGAIDKQYDAAVSNASGALDNIVVTTTASAQRCVDFLRRNELGVATFLILEKQQHLAHQMSGAFAAPPGAKRLFDLVQCGDASIKPAFYYALRNTLVCKDLDTARKIAHGGSDGRYYRVVTLQGELIADNGTMSGGGNRVTTGKMRLGKHAPPVVDTAAVREELERATQAAASAESERDRQQAILTESATALERATEGLERMKVQRQKKVMEIEAVQQKREDLQKQLSELEEAAQTTTNDQEGVKELDDVIAVHDDELEKLQHDAAGAEAQVRKAQQQLDDVGGPEMEQQKEVLATLKRDLQDADRLVAQQRAVLASASKTQKSLLADAAKKEEEAARLQAELNELTAGSDSMKDDLAAKEEEIKEKQQALQEARTALDEKRALLEQREEELGAVAEKAKGLEEALELRKGERTEAANRALAQKEQVTTLHHYMRKCAPEGTPVEEVTDEEVSRLDDAAREEVSDSVTKLKQELKGMKGDLQLQAIEEFNQKDKKLQEQLGELAAITETRDQARDKYEDLRRERLEGFMSGFLTISLKLKEMYQMITLGGDAELELVDSLDPFSEGIVFSVRPPKKSWKNIVNLSGGEKTLSSLSLVFALHHFKPTPVYFMDEIDAALDFKNVSIVAHYVKEQTKNAQFVVISLRNNMFELADHLVGIYKTHNCSKSVTIDPHQFVVNTSNERPVLQQQMAA